MLTELRQKLIGEEQSSRQLESAHRDWQQTRLGKLMVREQAALLQPIMTYSYRPLHLSIGAMERCLDRVSTTSIGHHVHLRMSFDQVVDHDSSDTSESRVLYDGQALPFDDDTFEQVCLYHGLECAKNPHHLLREVVRVTRPGGQIVVMGMNPVSIWGLMRLVLFRSRSFPWSSRYVSSQRLTDWLQLLACDIEVVKTGLFRWPAQSKSVADKMDWLVWLLRVFYRNSGGFYMLRAKKQFSRAIMMPKSKLAPKPKMVPLSLARRSKIENP